VSEQSSSQSGRRREEEEADGAADQAEKPKPDNQVSAAAEDTVDTIDRVLDEFDDVLKDTLGFPEGEVSDEELNQRVRDMVAGYVQKGGQ
jgi:hypothetical protein